MIMKSKKSIILFLCGICAAILLLIIFISAYQNNKNDSISKTIKSENIELKLLDAKVITEQGSTELQIINSGCSLNNAEIIFYSFGPKGDWTGGEQLEGVRHFPQWSHNEKKRLRFGAGEFAKYATVCKISIKSDEGVWENIYEWR